MNRYSKLLDPIYIDNNGLFTDKKPNKLSVPIGTRLDICIKGTKANTHYMTEGQKRSKS